MLKPSLEPITPVWRRQNFRGDRHSIRGFGDVQEDPSRNSSGANAMAKRKAKQVAETSASADEAGFVAYLKAKPNDSTAHAAYADWLDEHGRPLEAAEQRDAAGLSEVYYKLRRKSDGLFCEGRELKRGTPPGRAYKWSAKGKTWRKLEELRAHLAAVRGGSRTYGGGDRAGTAWNELEVVAFEVRAVELARLPLTFRKPGQGRDVKLLTIEKPAANGSA